MKCPTCPDQTLVMADRSGIEIDYCPACRGIWLDRGELDKLIERSTASAPTMPPPAVVAAPVPSRRDWDDDDDRRYVSYDKYGKPSKKKKAKNLFEEIFDF